MIKKILSDIRGLVSDQWHNATSFFEENHSFFEIFLTTLALGLAWFLFKETQRQADISNRTFNLMRENSQIELRAYVGVDSLNLQKPSLEIPMTFYFGIKNFGKTPATNVDTRKLIKIGTGIYESDFKILRDMQPVSYSVIPPETNLPQIEPFHRSYRISELDSIQKGILRPTILLIITYLDVFGIERETIVAAEYNHSLQGIYAVRDLNKMK